MAAPATLPGHVCLAAIVGAHGVRGLVRVKPFTGSADAVTAYGALTLVGRDGRARGEVQAEAAGSARDGLLLRLPGVTDRDAAEALKGATLQLPRARLPEPEEEAFYHADLIGLAVEDRSGVVLGRVVAIHDFGAGDVLELRGTGEAVFLPFTRAVVPVVDIVGGRLIADPPAEVVGEDAEAAA